MIELVKTINEANAITHGGSFHADDIFATIFLSQLKDIKLCRVNELDESEDYSDKIVYDIGMGSFDHHGPNAKVRENGIKYSAFGLLFEHLYKEYFQKNNISESEIKLCYQMFLKEFVLQIDAIDNGIFPENPKDYNITSLSVVIEWFNKTWKEEKESDKAFQEGLEIGNLIFKRIEKRIFDKIKAKEKVEEAIQTSENHLLILEEYMPFMDYILTSNQEKAREIYFAIFPSNRGGYNIRAINKKLGNQENRIDFPKEWGGKSQKELVELTKISSFRFCHSNHFLCSCDTLEDAIKIAKLAIKK